MINFDGETHVSTNTAAELVGVKPGTIRQWINRGKLSPVSGDSQRGYLLDIKDVYRVNEETKKRARREESVPQSDADKVIAVIRGRQSEVEDRARMDTQEALRMAVIACIKDGVDGIPEIVRDTIIDYAEVCRIRELPRAEQLAAALPRRATPIGGRR